MKNQHIEDIVMYVITIAKIIFTETIAIILELLSIATALINANPICVRNRLINNLFFVVIFLNIYNYLYKIIILYFNIKIIIY